MGRNSECAALQNKDMHISLYASCPPATRLLYPRATHRRHACPAHDYVVKDITLADWGRKEIAIAETEMPGLMATRAEFGASRSR